VTLDTVSHRFDLVQVLQERAQGYTMLWQPEKALVPFLINKPPLLRLLQGD
jgi:hypothetical protein